MSDVPVIEIETETGSSEIIKVEGANKIDNAVAITVPDALSLEAEVAGSLLSLSTALPLERKVDLSVSVSAGSMIDVKDEAGGGKPDSGVGPEAEVSVPDGNGTSVVATGAENSETNPYAYLARDEFSSERFKIEVKGLPKFYGFGELKKLLNNRLNLNAHKIKPPKQGSGYMFVNFRTEEDRQHAIKVLDGYTWKNKVLIALPARAAEDPLVRKRAHEEIDKGPSGFNETNESIEEGMKRVTIPWWNVPYEEQLQRKTDSTNKLVEDICQKVKDVNPQLKSEYEGKSLICPIEEIKPSPVTQEYRNKCEFTIGFNPKTSEKTVGFRMSSYRKGSVAVGPVEHLIHLPKKMIEGALAFQEFVRSSDLNPHDPETHSGCWKQLTVRTTCDGQLMLVVLINPKHMKAEEVESLKTSFKNTFATLESPKINSFFLKLQEDHGQQERNTPELVFGDEYITETLLGIQFRISPEAFFQINVKATEVLYSTVGSLIEANPETTVLDVCCGTGTIGLSVAHKCGQVLGIEMVSSAVQDAKKNAELNGLSEKCEFFAGKAEDVIDPVLLKAKYENIVAIVDPPRAGLHPRVLLLLRRCEKIKSLIYVACDAKAAMKNFVDLARPISNHYKGTPFYPKKVIPVDLFPHSHHCETVLLFERMES